jgi:hypothetical protein
LEQKVEWAVKVIEMYAKTSANLYILGPCRRRSSYRDSALSLNIHLRTLLLYLLKTAHGA